MPEKKTVEAAKKDMRQGKSPTTAAGEFVREEIHHVREGKHGARSTKQAIAIGLSKARRAGVPLKAPPKGTASAEHPTKATKKRPAKKRSRAAKNALKREPHRTASTRALSQQAKRAARRRPKAARVRAAKKAAATRKRTSGRTRRRTRA